MERNCLIALVLASSLVYPNEAYKILVVFPFPGVSHGILGNGYVEHLLNAGHEITYITPYPRKDPPPNLHQIHIDYPKDIQPMNTFSIDMILKKEVDMTNFSKVVPIILKIYNYLLKHESIQKLINDPKVTFDLVIAEWMFSEIYSGFAALFQCPLVWSSSTDPHGMVLRLVDEMPNPAYVPYLLSHNFPPFTFVQRVQEMCGQIIMAFVMSLIQWYCNSLYEEVFVAAGKNRNVTVLSLEEATFSGAFMLSNSHVSLGDPIRLPQNFIPIGGYHIDNQTKSLPEDLKGIMDNAKNGAIYFSLGSNLKSKDMPDKMKREFLKVFGKLNQTVLWKLEDMSLDLPKNVHMLKWAPQQSILAHPNCVLFITHGGLLSITETVHFGVPIIAIPVFGDQFINVDRAVNRGFAKKVDLSYDTPIELEAAIQEVLNNPSYRARVKFLSLVYHDRPVAPGKVLVHWVEHAIKTRGAPHFRSRALQLSWYQKMYLDLAALVAIILVCSYFILKNIFFRCRRNIVKSIKID